MQDDEAIQTVQEIEEIVYAPKPYSQIPKLPVLVSTFQSRFAALLKEEIAPVKKVIENDWDMVAAALKKHSLDELPIYDSCRQRFLGLLKRLKDCSNFSEAIAMKEESDRLKLRCFDEIEQKKRKDEDPGGSGYPQKELVTVSVAHLFRSSKILETAEDIDELLNELRVRLSNELKENTKLKLV